uniref:PH domain-containing protein n=1 Tax=Loa loa TaxID=7209 RepID=A0A1I7VA35_LOALO
MTLSVVPSKPKRYYLPLSLSFDDAEYRYKRWQYDIRQQLCESNIGKVYFLRLDIIVTDLRYFDAELFVHTTTLHPTMHTQQYFAKNQYDNLLSQKEMSLPFLRLTNDNNRLKQTESIPKQTLPQQLSKVSRSLTLTSSNGEQMSQKYRHERLKNIKPKKISKILLATKHISLLSSRHETDDNETDFVDTDYNRNHNTNSEIRSPTMRNSNRFIEHRLKTTFVTSAEKMKHVFYRNPKLVHKLKLFSPSV